MGRGAVALGRRLRAADIYCRRLVLRRQPYLLVGLCIVIASFILVLGTVLYDHGRARNVRDEKLNILTALLPPYVDRHGRGYERDIILAALAPRYREDQVEFFVQPFTRHWSSFLSDDRYQAVTTVPEGLALNGYQSVSYVSYQNGISYRMSAFPDGLDGEDFAALAGHRIVAFGGASRILSGLSDHVGSFALYVEEKRQSVHSSLLDRQIVDAVIADGAILFAYNQQFVADNVRADMAFAPFACATPYHMVFRDAELQAFFDQGIARLRASGRLQAMERRFISENGLDEIGYRVRRCG
ncbi:hypothetical protein ACKTEK_09990 [Tepidamorphus sp. 3E244]|uniref:hypothetical protein n=1 Tax=Tepidamorphus sp. 3E244 TaxID=3385498 RepID=UPI0038FD33A5